MKKSLMNCAGLMILIIVSLISGVSAESIDINYPENVVVGEEFNVNLTFNGFNEDVYSIKIDIQNGSNYLNQRFWEGSWYQNRWMYNATNTSETTSPTFKLKINENFGGVANLIVKIKSDNYNEATSIGYTINISGETQDSNPEETSNPSESETYFEFEWDEEDILSNQEFDIDVKGFNLDDEKYDVKLWIQDGDEKIISEIYNENEDLENEEDKWQSGQYYAIEIFSVSGNKSESVQIRLKEDYNNFTGDADILLRIRDEGGSIIYEDDKSIEILENEDRPIEETSPQTNDEDLMERAMELRASFEEQDSKINGNVIRLGSTTNNNNQETENIKSKNSIVYESSAEKIKKYSLFGFAFLCLMLSALLIKEKL